MNSHPLRAPWLQTIAQVFAGSRIYVVGGAVRNTLMNLPLSDVDLCGAARPEEVAARCKGTSVHARLRAAHFGTVELHVDGHMAEYTTFRQDSYRTGHQPVEVRFADSIEVDALRRDFSVNALYAPLDDPDTVLDPTGGLDHLSRHVLHTVTNDPDRVLKDDGLRILRAVRFQAELDFTLTQAVRQSCTKYAWLLEDIVADRKRDELTRILMADIKYPTLRRGVPPVSRALTALWQIGAWPQVFGTLMPPDVAAFDHAESLTLPEKFTLLYHRKTPQALMERMAALRYATRDGKAAADALSAIRALREPESELSDILCHGLPALKSAKHVLAALAAEAPEERQVYARAQNLLVRATGQQLPASLKELAINGNDLLAFCGQTGMPRERIGAVLNALWCDAVNHRVPNTREALLAQASRYWIDREPLE